MATVAHNFILIRFICGPITKLIMTHDCNTKGKNSDDNVANFENSLEKLVENIINSYHWCVNTMRD